MLKIPETYTHGCLCKIIISAIAIAITIPSYSDIATNNNNPTCDNATIGTTSGSTSLEAQWTANTINLDWYNGETKQTTTSCTYDGGITLPSTPVAPTGYVFSGWKVRSAVINIFSNIDTNINGTSFGYSRLNDKAGYNESTYELTSGSGEWAVSFPYGTIKGISSCSSVTRNRRMDAEGRLIGYTEDVTVSSDTIGGAEKTGGTCWCKVTDFNGAASPATDWVMAQDYYRTSPKYWTTCFADCASWCVARIKSASDFRMLSYGKDQYTNCLTINNEATCNVNFDSTSKFACKWNNSVCYSPVVNDCTSITNENICNSSYVGADGSYDACIWDSVESACFSVEVNNDYDTDENICETIQDQNRCQKSYVDKGCTECYWRSEIGCYTDHDCD